MGFCDICNKDFAHMSDHRRVHDLESRYYCQFPDCSTSYATKYGLNCHVRVAHTKCLCFFLGPKETNRKDVWSYARFIQQLPVS